MKTIKYFLLLILLPIELSTGDLDISEGFKLIQLNENTYIHSVENCNGIVFVKNGEALIVSSPPGEDFSKILFNYVEDSLGAEIKYFVGDNRHIDGIEGAFREINERNIKFYCHDFTFEFYKNNPNFPLNCEPFSGGKNLVIGGSTIELRYFGPAHTDDGITAWIPESKTLFGGNAVRNMNGWAGNIADAHLNEWAGTIRKIKAAYPEAETVIPGHGEAGGTGLLDYTIGLYSDFNTDDEFPDEKFSGLKIFRNFESFGIKADSIEDAEGGKFIARECLISIFREIEKQPEPDSAFHITANKALVDSANCEIMIDFGRMRKYSGNGKELNYEPVYDFRFKGMWLKGEMSKEGLVIVVREFVK
jgi:metallo-beta-lactamase class B